MGMISEFKEFIMRGNVMDMAVGVIVGGAFNTIVSSLVDDIIMPVISLATGKIDFTSLFIALDGHHPECSAVSDCRFRPVPCSQGNEQAAQAGTGKGSDHQDLPVLQERGADRGDQMRILHQRIVKITASGIRSCTHQENRRAGISPCSFFSFCLRQTRPRCRPACRPHFSFSPACGRRSLPSSRPCFQ